MGGAEPSVGVVGWGIGGGFGAQSKRFGTGSANMLQATVVTADGKVVVASEFQGILHQNYLGPERFTIQRIENWLKIAILETLESLNRFSIQNCHKMNRHSQIWINRPGPIIWDNFKGEGEQILRKYG